MAAITVVDDDDIFKAVVESALTSAGHTVTSHDNGADALEHLKAEPCNLLITDGMMPVMSGVELVRRLQEDEGKTALPVIVSSAREDIRLQMRERGLTVADYLNKPFDLDRLLATVDRLTGPQAGV